VVLGAGNKQIIRTESHECSGLHGKKAEDEEAGRLGNWGDLAQLEVGRMKAPARPSHLPRRLTKRFSG